MLAGLVFREMLCQYPQSAFQGSPRVAGGDQQQFATQTLRVHLLGLEFRFLQSRSDGSGFWLMGSVPAPSCILQIVLVQTR